jgi:Asp-tRNA(Asn)/Glu-tRNA(Gln) amidotransferase A subunit family amidase
VKASPEDACGLSLAQAAREIRGGRLRAAALAQALLDRIAAADGEIRAWAFLDPAHVMRQAEAADARLAEGRPIGKLHGVPVALKDIFETHDMPTQCGTRLYAGRATGRDAACVARLREAGAIVLGKTVTTEFCYATPGKTANPHDPRRTPGGSSSGSAAAVAARMAPGAVGSQTNGSVIRPASFCGVVGFKPTHGLIPRTGVLPLSRTLDHVGVFARTVEDAGLLAEVMAGFDAGDPDTRPVAAPLLSRTATAEPPLPPRFAFVRTPAWDEAEPSTHAAFGRLLDRLGGQVEERDLSAVLAPTYDFQATVMAVEMAHNLAREHDQAETQLSVPLREQIARGRAHRAVDYCRAVEAVGRVNQALDSLFGAFDAILTPSAPGEAPIGLGSTGNPIFCTPWSYLGLPAVSLPILQGPSGLPLGAQLVGRRGDDARLLRTAGWLFRAAAG